MDGVRVLERVGDVLREKLIGAPIPRMRMTFAPTRMTETRVDGWRRGEDGWMERCVFVVRSWHMGRFVFTDTLPEEEDFFNYDIVDMVCDAFIFTDAELFESLQNPLPYEDFSE